MNINYTKLIVIYDGLYIMRRSANTSHRMLRKKVISFIRLKKQSMKYFSHKPSSIKKTISQSQRTINSNVHILTTCIHCTKICHPSKAKYST